MGKYNLEIDLAQLLTAWVKAGGKTCVSGTKPITIFNAKGLKYAPNIGLSNKTSQVLDIPETSLDSGIFEKLLGVFMMLLCKYV